MVRGLERAEGLTHRHLLAPRPGPIRAEDAAGETLYPGPMALRAIGPGALAGLLATCPFLAPALLGKAALPARYGPPARPCATRADLRPGRPGLLAQAASR